MYAFIRGRLSPGTAEMTKSRNNDLKLTLILFFGGRSTVGPVLVISWTRHLGRLGRTCLLDRVGLLNDYSTVGCKGSQPPSKVQGAYLYPSNCSFLHKNRRSESIKTPQILDVVHSSKPIKLCPLKNLYVATYHKIPFRTSLV